MSIEVRCPEGHKLRVPERLAGKLVQCPRCKSATKIPAQATTASKVAPANEFDDDFDDLIAENEAKLKQKSERAQARRKKAALQKQAAADKKAAAEKKTKRRNWLQAKLPAATIVILPLAVGLIVWHLIYRPMAAPVAQDMRVIGAGTEPDSPPKLSDPDPTKENKPKQPPDPARDKKVAASDPVKGTLELPVDAHSVAMDPTTGNIAVVNCKTDQVWLLKPAWFDGDKSAIVGPVETPSQPTSAVFKTYKDTTYLAVTSWSNAIVTLLDPMTLKPLETQVRAQPEGTTGHGARIVSASLNRNDPYLYVGGITSSGHGIYIINLASSKPKLSLASQLGGGFYTMGVLPSDDGRYIYAYGTKAIVSGVKWTATAPSSLPLFRPLKRAKLAGDRPPIPLDQKYIVRGKETRISVDPLGQRWEDIVGRPVGSAAGGHAFATLNENTLHITYHKNATTVKELPIPKLLARNPEVRETIDLLTDKSRYELSPRRFFFHDEHNHRLLLISGRYAWQATIEPDSLLPPPVTMARVDIPKHVTFGEPAEFAIDADSRMDVTLTDGPPGMRLEDGKLRWTPTAGTVGEFDFTLTIRHADTTTQQTHKICVIQPSIEHAIPATDIAIGPKGQRVVTWSTADPFNIALYDAKGMKVLATKRLPMKVRQVLIADDSIIAMGSNAEATTTVRSLDPDTLNELGTWVPETQPTREKQRLRLFGNQLLGFRSYFVSKKRLAMCGPREVVSLPDFRNVRVIPPTLDSIANEEGTNSHGAFMEGVLWDGTATRPKLLCRLDEFLPAWAGTRRKFTNKHRLANLSPVTNEIARSVNKQHVAVLTKTGITLPPPYDPDQVALDLRINQSQSVIVVSGRRCRVEYGINGGAPPYAYTSATLRTVPAKGTIGDHRLLSTWDNELIYSAWEPAKYEPVYGRGLPGKPYVCEFDILRHCQANLTQYASQLAASRAIGEAATERINRYVAKVEPRFNLLTGRKPTGVPVVVAVSVTMADRGEDEAGLSHLLLYELPRDEVLLALHTHLAIRHDRSPIATEAIDYIKSIGASPPTREHNTLRLRSRKLRESHPVANMPWTPTEIDTAAAEALEDYNKTRGRDIAAAAGQEEEEEEGASAPAEPLLVIAKALKAYRRRHNEFPADIVDPFGRPLLSWRVALLPYMGATKLYSLFRPDEPWDSPHNLALQRYMPGVYGLSDEGTTNISGISDPRSLFPGTHTVKRASEATLFAVSLQQKHEVPWTKPGETDLSSGKYADKLDFKNGVTGVILANGKIATVRRGMPKDEWRRFALIERSSSRLQKYLKQEK